MKLIITAILRIAFTIFLCFYLVRAETGWWTSIAIFILFMVVEAKELESRIEESKNRLLDSQAMSLFGSQPPKTPTAAEKIEAFEAGIERIDEVMKDKEEKEKHDE